MGERFSEQALRDIVKAIRELEAIRVADEVVKSLPDGIKEIEKERIIALILNSQDGSKNQSGKMEGEE